MLTNLFVKQVVALGLADPWRFPVPGLGVGAGPVLPQLTSIVLQSTHTYWVHERRDIDHVYALQVNSIGVRNKTMTLSALCHSVNAC